MIEKKKMEAAGNEQTENDSGAAATGTEHAGTKHKPEQQAVLFNEVRENSDLLQDTRGAGADSKDILHSRGGEDIGGDVRGGEREWG